MPLDYNQDFQRNDFRTHPERYHVDRREQGVQLVEPYKSEILPHWRFRTPQIARASADAIYALYLDYRNRKDFVGMDMARKFLQMGYTRARRYATHGSGRKFAKGTREMLPEQSDPDKAEAAVIFKAKWQLVRNDPEYQRLLEEHRHLEASDDR